MKIKFPINNVRDYDTVLAIIRPDLFDIEYASKEARDLYNSLTEDDIKEIKEYIEHCKKIRKRVV